MFTAERWCALSFCFFGRFWVFLGFRHSRQPALEETLIIVRPLPRQTTDKTRINDMIRARQIRVISSKGDQLGIMAPSAALQIAEDEGLDLVEVAPKAEPPVCRIMDYGKYRYQMSKRAKESKKHQHTVTVKEIKYRPKTGEHDYENKTKHVREFLQQGNKVKVTIMFRGREMAHPEFGREILEKVVQDVKDLCKESPGSQFGRLEGKNMSIVLNPAKASV